MALLPELAPGVKLLEEQVSWPFIQKPIGML